MLMRREHSPSPPPELWARVLLARRLNEQMRCSVFHAWNVGEIPAVDLEILDAWASLDAQMVEAEARAGQGEKGHGG